jgi:hypothetical protein
MILSGGKQKWTKTQKKKKKNNNNNNKHNKQECETKARYSACMWGAQTNPTST